MTENNEEKPKVELVQSKEMTPLFTIEICEPVKEQLDKINFCGPNIVVKPCNPIQELKCLPDVPQLMPDRGCQPVIWSIADLTAPTHCMPWLGEPKPEMKVDPRGCIPRIWLISELVYRPQGCIPMIWLAEQMTRGGFVPYCIPGIHK